MVSDFDSDKEEVRGAIRKIKYTMPYTSIDDKFYNCLKADLQKTVFVEFGHRKDPEKNESRQDSFQRAVSYQTSGINLHENRDRLKKI